MTKVVQPGGRRPSFPEIPRVSRMSRKALSSIAEQTGLHHLVTKSGSSSRTGRSSVAHFEVFPQAVVNLRAEGDVSALVELRPVDEQRLPGEIDMADAKAADLPVSQPQGGQQRQHGRADLCPAGAPVVIR